MIDEVWVISDGMPYVVVKIRNVKEKILVPV